MESNRNQILDELIQIIDIQHSLENQMIQISITFDQSFDIVLFNQRIKTNFQCVQCGGHAIGRHVDDERPSETKNLDFWTPNIECHFAAGVFIQKWNGQIQLLQITQFRDIRIEEVQRGHVQIEWVNDEALQAMFVDVTPHQPEESNDVRVNVFLIWHFTNDFQIADVRSEFLQNTLDHLLLDDLILVQHQFAIHWNGEYSIGQRFEIGACLGYVGQIVDVQIGENSQQNIIVEHRLQMGESGGGQG